MITHKFKTKSKILCLSCRQLSAYEYSYIHFVFVLQGLRPLNLSQKAFCSIPGMWRRVCVSWRQLCSKAWPAACLHGASLSSTTSEQTARCLVSTLTGLSQLQIPASNAGLLKCLSRCESRSICFAIILRCEGAPTCAAFVCAFTAAVCSTDRCPVTSHGTCRWKLEDAAAQVTPPVGSEPAAAAQGQSTEAAVR